MSMFDIIFTILVNLFLWIYLIKCLIGAKKVEYECRSGSKVVIFVFFIVLGIIIYLRQRDILGVISLASFLIASGVYHIIPSGFSSDSVIVMGRVYPFNKISDMELRKEDKQIVLTFVYKKRAHLLFGNLDQANFMKAYFDLYMKQARVNWEEKR